MPKYTRKDQIAVAEAYEALQEKDGIVASAERAARRAGVDCSRTTAQRWLKDEEVLRSRKEASNAHWSQKYGDKWKRLALYVEAGYTISEVAERFDVSTQMVHTASKRAGLDLDWSQRRHRLAFDPSTPRGQKRQEKVRKMAEKVRHRSKREVADEYDITRRHLNRLLKSPLNPYNNESYDPGAKYSA